MSSPKGEKNLPVSAKEQLYELEGGIKEKLEDFQTILKELEENSKDMGIIFTTADHLGSCGNLFFINPMFKAVWFVKYSRTFGKCAQQTII